MDTVGKKRSAPLSALLAVALLVLTTNVSSDAPPQGATTLWVGESKGLYVVSDGSGDVHSRNVPPDGAECIAGNPANGDVWGYCDGVPYRFLSSGAPPGSFSTPAPLLLGAPSRMIAAPQSGNVW